MPTSTVDAGLVFTDPTAYADERRFHEACALLRRQSPVHRVEAGRFDPFWAITRHEDVVAISRQPDRWLNAPRPALAPRSAAGPGGENLPIRALVQMDPPDHPAYRRITSDWFKPTSIARLEPRIEELARSWVDRMAEYQGQCDFVSDIALHFPLYVILSVLGLPEADYPLMLRLTQEMFGAADPEMAADQHSLFSALTEFFEYFKALVADRQEHPRDDLASVIANARIDGQPIGLLETIGYYVLIATAGHDTTSSSIAGGLLALVEHPDQLALLQTDPSLIPTAVDEMIRWVSPVKQFMRTAVHDSEVRGVSIAAGESVLLSYPSANRDEEVFEEADRLVVSGTPNRHVGFGFGAHFCLGASLARMEARAFFSALVPRIRSVELAGHPAFVETLFVGGPKHLPIRYELT